MFHFKENARLMPCMEQVGLTAFTISIPTENNKKEKLSLHEGTSLIVEYQDLQKEINNLNERISILETKKSEILDKINNDSILMGVLKDVINEMDEKDNKGKTK